MLPAGPIADLIIGQTRFALAPLETFFDAVFRLGHAGKLLQRGLRDRIGQIIVHFHDLILVAVTVAYHRQQFLVALLTPMGSGDHTPFDHLDHQRPFRTIADIDAPPGRIVKRLAPGHTLCQGRWGDAPSRRTLVAVVSRSRIVVFEGTASRYRSPKLASRRRNQEGRPISSSPAIQRCGRAAPCVASISNAHW